VKLEFLLVSIGVQFNVPDVDVKSISLCTETVERGTLYFAISEDSVARASHIKLAISNGAVAIITVGDEVSDFIPIINLSKSKKQYIDILAIFYQRYNTLKYYIGVTGTNGKTTVVNWIRYLAKNLGVDIGCIGTLGVDFSDVQSKSVLTTPDIVSLYSILDSFAMKNAMGAAIEVSSHGLSQGRVEGVPLSIGVFTNISQDHLDYHCTMDEYFHAKTKMFTDFNLKYAIFNLDDEKIKNFLEYEYRGSAKVIGYSTKADVSCGRCNTIVRADDIQINRTSTKFTLHINNENFCCEIPTIGLYNVANVLAAVSAIYATGLEITHQITVSLSSLPTVPGRLELVASSTITPSVWVDFAHTPDGLDNLLQGAREACNKKLVVVFGCGGDRDRNKRPKMLAAVLKYADKIYITQDNSRTEKFSKILTDITFIHGSDDPKINVISDRREAIAAAISNAEPDDFVVIAGRGHEAVQDLGAIKLEYTDSDAVKSTIAKCTVREKINDY
jgi:UDP-N-acetylmuramoyl-L-alanyl-D-glutamate--2,6-diaminopimelate ligase